MTMTQTPTRKANPSKGVYFDTTDAPQSTGARCIGGFLSAIKEDKPVPSPAETHPLAKTWSQVNALYDLPENWNGYDVSAPNPDAIEYAKSWLQELYKGTVTPVHKWINPHVSANEDGDVVLQWSQTDRKLTVYLSPLGAYYIKAWGPHIINDMEDGDANTYRDRLRLWHWLKGSGAGDHA